MLSETSQFHKDALHVFSHKWNRMGDTGRRGMGTDDMT
jgi:hypothetical protein